MARTDDDGATNNARTIAGVERALDVLMLFAEDGVASLGVTEIADRLDLSKAVVHRILSSFKVKGFVEIEDLDRRYRLGPQALTLGLAYLDRVDAIDLARGALARLSAMTNETATLSVRVDWSRVYIDQVLPARDLRMDVQLGSAHPLHAGASSKVLLAFLPQELQDSYVADHDLAAVTPDTIVNRRKLKEELATIRRQGYGMSLGERQVGAGSVAAPILSHEGTVVAVVSVCGPVGRFRDEIEQCAKALLAETHAVSEALGYHHSG